MATSYQNFRFGAPSPTWYSLSSPEGNDFAPLRTPRRQRELGIYFPSLGLHSFRREVATLLQEAGGSTVEVQLLLGHSKPQMTGHYTLRQKRRMEKLVRSIQKRLRTEGWSLQHRNCLIQAIPLCNQ